MATFRKLKSGKWNVQIRKKNNQFISKTFIEKSLARKWAREIENQIDKNIYEDYTQAETTTLRDIIKKYRDEIVVNHKASRSTTYRCNFLIRNKIAHLTLMQLKSQHIYKFKEELQQKDKAPKTINIYVNLLSAIWLTAKKRWSISLPAQSPFELVVREYVNNLRDRILTADEYQRLLHHASESQCPPMRDIIMFAFETAARWGEITSLQRKNVDFTRNLATFVDTKNGDDRTVPLSDKAVEILKRHPFGSRFFQITYDSFRAHFERVRDAAELGDFRFHDLRACAATRLLLSGLSIAEVASITGHKDWSSLKRYARIKPTDLLEKVNNVVAIK
jgi:integrase|tara:strand:+ start:750 stop:1751 length:1002 start_codon:yes stop_codon:yes gene_type:complete